MPDPAPLRVYVWNAYRPEAPSLVLGNPPHLARNIVAARSLTEARHIPTFDTTRARETSYKPYADIATKTPGTIYWQPIVETTDRFVPAGTTW